MKQITFLIFFLIIFQSAFADQAKTKNDTTSTKKRKVEYDQQKKKEDKNLLDKLSNTIIIGSDKEETSVSLGTRGIDEFDSFDEIARYKKPYTDVVIKLSPAELDQFQKQKQIGKYFKKK